MSNVYSHPTMTPAQILHRLKWGKPAANPWPRQRDPKPEPPRYNLHPLAAAVRLAQIRYDNAHAYNGSGVIFIRPPVTRDEHCAKLCRAWNSIGFPMS